MFTILWISILIYGASIAFDRWHLRRYGKPTLTLAQKGWFGYLVHWWFLIPIFFGFTCLVTLFFDVLPHEWLAKLFAIVLMLSASSEQLYSTWFRHQRLKTVTTR
jgi:hypothetical protein